MEKLYTINDNNAKIIISKEIYPMVSIKKALANFLDCAYFQMDTQEDSIIIHIQLKKNNINLSNLIGELYNEFLRESLRYDISIETKNLRELIVGRALYTACIQVEDEQSYNKDVITEKISSNQDENEYALEDIAQNWFDKYGKKEDEKC